MEKYPISGEIRVRVIYKKFIFKKENIFFPESRKTLTPLTFTF